MSENLNRKRKSKSDPDLNPQEEPPINEIQQVSEVGEVASSEEVVIQSSTKPHSSSLKLPILAGLGAGLFGGALAALVVLVTPYLNTYLFKITTSNRLKNTGFESVTAERINLLEAKLAALQSFSADVSKTDMTLSSRVEKLEKTVTENPVQNTDSASRIGNLEVSLNTLSKQQTGHNGAALMLATDSLKRKFERGVGFSPEFKAVESWVDPSFNLNALKQYAESGLPSVQRISQNFADLSPTLIKEAMPVPEGLLGRVGAAASSLVKMRPSTEPNATDALSITSRVQASLARNDAGAALDDLAKLEEPALSKATPIIRSLKARLDVEAAIRALEQNALQSLNLKKN